LSRTAHNVIQAFLAAVGRLDKSISPTDTIRRFRKHSFTPADSIYVFHMILATFWLTIMESPGFPFKLVIPALYLLALLVPLTSQFFLPATPVFAWVLTYFTSRYIPSAYRPSISVSLLPTLESVLYGANISDILTRFTHPVLDIVAWLPYGVIHFTFPFVVAAFLWLFRSKEALHLWARAFGYMNLIGVFIQILFPCAAPWYELIYGLTPADYSMHGSPGGLARIDALFHSQGYTTTFSNSPVVFGAFPSLHAGCATIEALFISHFFPHMTRWIWGYAGVLYWATMYLSHHYLIDVVGGACLAVASFYLFLPDELRGAAATAPPAGLRIGQRSKYDMYDLEAPRHRSANGRASNGVIMDEAADIDLSEVSSHASDEEEDIAYRSPVPGGIPTSAIPFVGPSTTHGTRHPGRQHKGQQHHQARRNHRHTASIASLIRADERGEDGWSPIRTAAYAFPPLMRTERERDGAGNDDGR
jgi:inositol phosphorylceramide synthase catalytic subunit